MLNAKHLPIKAPGSRKLKPVWVGPYRIISRVGENAYTLDLPSSLHKLHPTFNVTLLKKYIGSVIPPPDAIVVDNEDEYEVESILAHRRTRRIT